MTKREDAPFRVDDLDLTVDVVNDLKQKIICADWDDLVGLEQKLQDMQRALEAGDRYVPRF